MENICIKLNKLLKKPEEYLRPDTRLEDGWREGTKLVYDFIKKEESRYDLPAPSDALPKLHTAGLDSEQVWQLVELQNGPLVSAVQDVSSLSDTNLCLGVARLSSLAKMGRLTLGVATDDEGIGPSADDDSDGDMMNDSDEMEADDLDGDDYEEDEVLLRIPSKSKDLDGEEMDNDDSDDEEDDDDDVDKDLLGRPSKNLDDDETDGDEEDEEMDGDEEDDLFGKPEDFDADGLDVNFDNESDDEEDNFDEFIAPEGRESDDSDAEAKIIQNLKSKSKEIPDEKEKQKKKSKETIDDKLTKLKKKGKEKIKDKNLDTLLEDDFRESESDSEQTKSNSKLNRYKEQSQSFKKTSIDTKFFQLRESEWVADNDAIGENFEANSEDDIDLMADLSDGSEGEDGAMYSAFFDNAPEDGDDEGKRSKKLLSQMLNEGDDDDDEEEDMEDDTDKKAEEQESKEEQAEAEREEGTQLLGVKRKERKSRFEMEREREMAIMGQLEEDNVGDRPWYLRGEAVSADRPEDSALQQRLEYDVGARQKPLITDDTTTLIERIILGRARSKAWDDVERKVKPNLDPKEYKKKLLLDQDKNKKSLAELYEQEYVKQQEAKKDDEEEPEDHKEIRKMMDSLFKKLDALSNYHYTPYMPTAELKIRSNLPAISVEEATPDTATSASLLAPQEVLEPVRGELVGTTERTSTDRKRERRMKKTKQKQQAQRQERKLSEKLKKVDRTGGKLDQQSTLKVIQKAVKAGHVKMLEGSQEKSIKSSQAVFKKLQDDKSAKVKKQQGIGKKKKNDSTGQTNTKRKHIL